MNINQWRKNKIIIRFQSQALVVLMAALLGSIGWLIGGPILALMAVSATIFLYFSNPLFSPALILRAHRARRLDPREIPRLYAATKKLAQRAGLAFTPSLYLNHGGPVNAFTVGEGRHAAIAVSGSLIRNLNQREIEAVLAHEISHIRDNDTRVMGFAVMVGRLTSMLSLFGQVLLFINLPLLLLGEHTISWLFILMLIIAPTISMLMQLTLSRTREYQADLGAAELTGDPGALASALIKIEQAQQRFFNRTFWPLKQWPAQSEIWRTHPPTLKRVRRLLAMRNRYDDWGRHPYPEYYAFPAA